MTFEPPANTERAVGKVEQLVECDNCGHKYRVATDGVNSMCPKCGRRPAAKPSKDDGKNKS